MEASELEAKLLTREEVPIHGIEEGMEDRAGYGGNLDLWVPIHPDIFQLSQEIRFDNRVALSVINGALDWFYEDMEAYDIKNYGSETKIEHKDEWKDGDDIPIGKISITGLRGSGVVTFAGRGGDAALTESELDTRRLHFQDPEKVLDYISEGPKGLKLEVLKRASTSPEDYEERVRDNSKVHFYEVMNGDFVSDYIFLRAWAINYTNRLLSIAAGK